MIRGIVTDILARTLYFIYKKYTFQCNFPPVKESSQLYNIRGEQFQSKTFFYPFWLDLWWEDHKPKIKHLGLTNVLVGIVTN